MTGKGFGAVKFLVKPVNTKPTIEVGFAHVWVTGFEPAASCTPCKRATKLRYTQIRESLSYVFYCSPLSGLHVEGVASNISQIYQKPKKVNTGVSKIE